ERIDPTLLEAAADLGARPRQSVLSVVLPIAKTGLLVAFALCFISMMGDYVTPILIGGTRGAFFSALVVTKFGFSEQWGFGSALAFILLATVLAVVALLRAVTGAVG